MRVSDYIADRLVEAGIRHVFMISGGGSMHLNDSLGNHPKLEYICTHHEQAAAMAAEGYYRATGRMAAVCVTTGPGGTNAMTGVAGQWLDSIPCIYISGQCRQETLVTHYDDGRLRQLGDQELNIIRLVSSITKLAAQIHNPQLIGGFMDQLLGAAQRPRFGPVWLDVPLDVQAALIDPKTVSRCPDEAHAMSPDLVAAAVAPVVELLQQAQRPVIVAGHGVRLSGGVEHLNRLVAKLGCPVVTTFNGYDIVPNANPYFIGRATALGDRAGNLAIQNSDLLITIGTRNSIRQVSFNWPAFARAAKRVVVDVDASELNKPTLRVDLPILLDAKQFMGELFSQVSHTKLPSYGMWLSWARERRERYPTVLPEYGDCSDGVHPYYFVQRLTERLSDDACVVAGDGTACVVLYQAGVVKGWQRQFWNSGCAAMGYDLPAAIGASIGRDKGPVVCITGDGSLQLNLQELQTIAHHKLPIKLFVLNNGGYLSIKQTQDTYFKRRVACDAGSGVTIPDISGLAAAYRIPYVAMHTHSHFYNSFAAMFTTDGPAICEVFCTPNYRFSPKLSSVKLPDGRMVSRPLEDMWPFLPREELLANMIIEPWPE